MRLGSWQLDTVSGGKMLLDGGTIFGIIPKAMWQKVQPADENNRIQIATNCVLARDGRHTVLVDTGYGGKFSDKERGRAGLEPGEPLLASLAALGVSPEEIDTVALSHLHFDHAGGGTRKDATGKIVTTFPNARYFAQRGEWQTALSGVPELRGAYPLEHLLPVEESGRLILLEGDGEIVPGLSGQVTGGHTEWHQALVFSSEGETAVYLGDLCPTAASVRTFWGMSYDTDPLETRRRKPLLLGQAADEGWLLMWDHDPKIAAGRIARDPDREFVVTDPMPAL